MKHKISSILVCSLFSVASCMQAEKVSLDTSGAEGLLLSGLSIELGLLWRQWGWWDHLLRGWRLQDRSDCGDV